MGSYGNADSIRHKDEVFVLVTGTNSGLGQSICRRLIDKFLETRPESQSFTLLFTTRSAAKSHETLTHLKKHLSDSPFSAASKSRVTLQPEHVDLGDLPSVRALSRRLRSSLPKLDAIVLNAGVGGFTGLNWFRAVYMVLTDLVHAVTWPSSYCLKSIGLHAKKQTSLPDEPALGQIFCANVFGHYMLSHNLTPLLSTSADSPGRIVWISSVEATREAFDVDDIQALQAPRAYESVKYLTDVLALTSSLPSTAPWVDSFLSPTDFAANTTTTTTTKKLAKSNDTDKTISPPPPNMYLAHPGVCATSILPLILPLRYAMIAAFFLARMLGSPWHVLSSYLGACAPVWLVLASQSVLDAAEDTYTHLGGGGKAKWGSSCGRRGRETVVCTEVEGWGYAGVLGGPVLEEDKRRRRKRGARDLSAEERVEFEELGRKCWREMEELRKQWDALLSRAEAEA